MSWQARTGRSRRGWPVLSIVLLLGFWVVLRAAFWPAPLSLRVLPPLPLADGLPSAGAARIPAPVPELPGLPAAGSGMEAGRFDWSATGVPDRAAPALERRPERPVAPPLSFHRAALPALQYANAQGDDHRLTGRQIVGHTLLAAAAFSRMDVAGELLPYLQGAGPRLPLVARPEPIRAPVAAERFARETALAAAPARWSMDAWTMWREEDSSPLLSGRPSYGRSQIGAVLRYRLAPSSSHAPQAYVRASAALAGGREQEVALGLSARPLPGVPVRVMGEARLREAIGGSGLRTAALAVSEFPPLALPGQATGEAYVAAGYVTGADATGFVDGQARITRELASGENFRLNAGGGAWGGAQEGAGRLDVGPSASLSLRFGSLNTRVSADYRVRVAGEAQPASGPALTISAGF